MIQLSKLELNACKTKFDLVKKVVLQVQKDFQLYDEKIEFSGKSELAYDELSQQIEPVIFRMLELDSARFFSLLYAIDVEEEKVKELLFWQSETDVSKELTHLILERELLKVVSRQIYAQQIKKD
ncbi:MAG: hypothetical protein ACI9DK_001356 [Vicingaceae bacterium]|jgi:hypothetical protein